MLPLALEVSTRATENALVNQQRVENDGKDVESEHSSGSFVLEVSVLINDPVERHKSENVPNPSKVECELLVILIDKESDDGMDNSVDS